MKWAILLMFALLIPIPVCSGEVNEINTDNIKISIGFFSPNEEIVAHYEAPISFNVVFDFTLSEYHNISTVIVNNFTIAYIAFENDDRIMFDHTTFLNHNARNTSDPLIFEYGQGLLEQLKSNPFTRSRIDILVFTEFTIDNLNINSTYQISTMFSGPILVNPLSITDLIQYVIILGIVIIVLVIIILKMKNRKRRLVSTIN